MAGMQTDPYATAARQLLAREGHRLPDLSGLTVLVPHYHAAQALLAALRREVAQPVFLPPRLVTLAAWAASVPGRAPAEPDSLRLAEVYAFLKASGRLPGHRLWPAASELAALLRELSDGLLAPPRHYAEFAARLEAIHGRALNAPMGLEASLAFELWYALQQARVPDRARDYAERLGSLADAAAQPLYHLGLAALSAVERRFLERYARRQPVRELDLPPGQRAAFLSAAWDWEAAPLRVRADSGAGMAPLAGEWAILGARSLEEEAQAAAAHVLEWLAEGREGIAVVVLDRMGARRLRALLERHRVLVQDETGWTFSTAAVSHVLDRWFALLQDDCYHRDLLDFLKSPYVLADVEPATRRRAVAELEQAVRRKGVVEGLARFVRLARESGLEAAGALLARLGSAQTLFAPGRRPLGDWQARLLGALDRLGATPAFEADAAGAQLLALLRRLGSELAGDAALYGYAEWRRWLLLHLDEATFVEAAVDSPVCFTHLRAARLRAFDGLVLLGADAARLPERPRPGFFSEAVRRELGLPGQAQREAELRGALADVLGRAGRVLVTWRVLRDGEPGALSPWLEALDLYHRLACGTGLKAPVPAYTAAGASPAALPAPEAPPAPAPAVLPDRVSVSAWQGLVDCPYRFYARHLLRLNELDEVAEEMDKRDYGTLVHAALARFHTAHPELAAEGRAELEAALAAEIDAAFGPARENQFLAEAWRLRWQRRQAAYLDWALAWERAGWRFERAEALAAVEVALPGGTLRFEGRLDRLDAGRQGPAVLDYKTQSAQTLRAKLRRPGEDVQLPAYAWLAGAAAAGFVCLDADRVEALAWPGDLAEAAEREAARFGAAFAALAAGAPLPAQGAAAVCRHCEMRGLCRRDYWPAADERPR